MSCKALYSSLFNVHSIYNVYIRAVITDYRYGTKLDVWAAGVVTYLIICGSLPFGRYKLK